MSEYVDLPGNGRVDFSGDTVHIEQRVTRDSVGTRWEHQITLSKDDAQALSGVLGRELVA